jgi:hypothetical protein
VERVKDTKPSAEVFENDISLWLDQWKEEQKIEDLCTISQQRWNAALYFIYKHVFKNNPDALKDKTLFNNGSCASTHCGRYDYNLCMDVLNIYIHDMCMIYDKEISIVGYTTLTGINYDTVMEWGYQSNKFSSMAYEIFKKLNQFSEESLSDKLISSKTNPVGVIAVLNHRHGWASPYTSDANRNRTQVLGVSELPQLGALPSTTGGQIKQLGQLQANKQGQNAIADDAKS